MSIDIDGNDYWVWDAISVTSPKAVIIETHIEFGLKNIVVPYDKDYVYPGRHPDYHGASPVAMEKLARRKGYRLVGANRLGFNTIYLREGLAPILPTVSVGSILSHPQPGARSLIRANQGLEIRAGLTREPRTLEWNTVALCGQQWTVAKVSRPVCSSTAAASRHPIAKPSPGVINLLAEIGKF